MERPLNIDAVKRLLYRQQCLEEYNAEIENNANMDVSLVIPFAKKGCGLVSARSQRYHTRQEAECDMAG